MKQNNKKTNIKTVIIFSSLLVILAIIGGGSYLYIKNHSTQQTNIKKVNRSRDSMKLKPDFKNIISAKNKKEADKIYQIASNSEPKNGQNIFEYINNNQSYLSADSWSGNGVKFDKLDQYNRPTGVTAFLNKENLVSNSNAKFPQFTVNPLGWQNSDDKQAIYLKAPLLDPNIAKGLGNMDKKENVYLATGMFYRQDEDKSNIPYGLYLVNNIRAALSENKKVIYQAKLVYRDKEIVPRGVLVSAISTDKKLNFNVYIANVINGYAFDYQTGQLKPMEITDPKTKKKSPLIYKANDPILTTTDTLKQNSPNGSN